MSFVIEDAEAIIESAKAICIKSAQLDQDEWIPRSQIDDDSEVYKKGDTGECVISDWLAEQKGLL